MNVSTSKHPRIAVVVASVFAIGLAVSAGAKDKGHGKGRYWSRIDVEDVIRDAENASDAFRKKMDATLDRSSLDGTNREDNINEQTAELENALDRLREHFDRSDRWNSTRREVQEVLYEARDVDRIMSSGNWRNSLEIEWNQLVRDLDTLARVYDLPRVGRY